MRQNGDQQMKASIRGLELFRSIMLTGSISKSSVELAISQPTASGLLKRLEDSIGLILFERSAFGLSPTPEAIKLLPEVDRMFQHLDHVQTKIVNIAEGDSAFLSVQSLPSMSQHFVAPTIKLLCEHFPKATVSIHSGQSSQVVNSIRMGAFDVGFVYGARENSTLEYIPLKKIKFECVVRADHRLAQESRVEPEDLHDENLILNRSGTYLRNALNRALRQHDIPVSPKVETGTLQAYDLINSGIGIGILDTSLLSDNHYPDLIAVPTFMNIEVEACAIFNKATPLSRIAHQYLTIVQGFFNAAQKTG
jgi:DNA-binding transcriptional LysR family regulator